MMRLARLASACALATSPFLATAAPVPAASNPTMVPATAKFPIADGRELVLSHPAYLSASVEDTPYQLMQACEPQGRSCKTLLDLRGGGAGVSVPASRKLGFSPDRRYLLCLRMSGVDAPHKAYRGQEYELYDLASGEAVDFTTAEGTSATADNILGWSASEPHALEVSAGVRKSVLALPPQ